MESKLFRKLSLPFPLDRRTIGRYELICPLSSGGMATVYLGRLSGIAGFEKLVAVKVVHPHLVTQQKIIDMFLDEARLSAKIHHPNIVETFEVGEEEGLYFLVAELVRGQSLRQLIEAARRAKERLEPAVYMSIIARVCDALHAAHTLKDADGSPLGLVHRDISPSNVMISYDGIVKLIDFGIAIAKGRIANKTEAGVVKGKLDYMAPEQLRRKAVDKRSDIFSVGVVLYKLATGRHPFFDTEAEKTLEEQLKYRATPPRQIVPSLAPELERTILKALSENPDNRHQTAKELSDELRNMLVPQGALVDRQKIADLMSRLFSQEIVEDAHRFENATNTNPLKKTSDAAEQREHDPQIDKITGPNASRRDMKAPVTDILSPSFEEPYGPQSRRPLILVAFVFAACLIVFLAWFFGYRKPGERQPDTQLTNQTLPAQAPPTPTSQPQPEPSATSDKAQVGMKTVKILLSGLPVSAEVKLDGADATVAEGKLILPADDAERVLQITAKGYKPYVRKIKPNVDGELVVKLKKKRTRQSKQGHSKSSKQKTGPKNKLQTCPYCD